MLKGKLLHPGILAVLGASGHGSKILIADGNYPFGTSAGPNAQVVYLNLTPGKVTVPEVLQVLNDTIPIEAAAVMVPDSGDEPPIFQEFRNILGKSISLKNIKRFDFYDTAQGADCALVIATGEQRVYANILLTIGVVPPM